MKSLALFAIPMLAIASCAPEAITPAPITEVNNQELAQQIVDAPKPTPDAGPAVVADPVEIAAAQKPVTVSGGTGSVCLAVDVLANSGAFVRAGTAGALSGDTFTVNGTAHDLSGIPYSVKDC